MFVIIESPFTGDIEANLAYVRAAMRDSLQRGESPFASHALYTQPGVLDDTIGAERAWGIEAGFAFRHAAGLTAFYIDHGVSRGMALGAKHAVEIGCPVELRALHGATAADFDAARKALGLPMVGEPHL